MLPPALNVLRGMEPPGATATALGLMDSVFLETMPTAEVTQLPPAPSVAQMKAIAMVTVAGRKESVNPQPQVLNQKSCNSINQNVMFIVRRMPTEEHDLCQY